MKLYLFSFFFIFFCILFTSSYTNFSRKITVKYNQDQMVLNVKDNVQVYGSNKDRRVCFKTQIHTPLCLKGDLVQIHINIFMNANYRINRCYRKYHNYTFSNIAEVHEKVLCCTGYQTKNYTTLCTFLDQNYWVNFFRSCSLADRFID